MTLKMQIHKTIGKSTDPYMNIIIFLNSIVIYGIQPSIVCTFTVIMRINLYCETHGLISEIKSYDIMICNEKIPLF